MSLLTQADNDELDAQLLAQNNVIDGLSLVIAKQQAVMRQALECLEELQGGCTDSNDGTVEAITVWCPEVIDALCNSLEGKQ